MQLIDNYNWDRCGSNITILNNSIAIKTGVAGWNATVLSFPIKSSYSLRVAHRGASGNIMVGLAVADKVNLNGTNYTRSGWYYYVNNGNLYSQNGDNSRAYAQTQYSTNITVVYDRETRTIKFIVDGIDLGVAYKEIVGELCPCVEMHDQGSIVELVELV